jgi:hypothetical protein
MIELVLTRAQTGLDITQALSKSKLAKSHAEKLIPTREGFYLILATITPHAASKLFRMDQIGELGENKLSDMHPPILAKNLLGENRIKISNRSHPITLTGTA